MQNSNKKQKISYNSAATNFQSISNPHGELSEYQTLLNALEKIKYGKLLLETPDYNSYIFGNGNKGPEVYLKINNWDALNAIITHGEIGFGEAYVADLWDTDELPKLLILLLSNTDIVEDYFYGHPLRAILMHIKSLRNTNSLSGSRRNIHKHYDLGNDFYSLWLDKSMTYSCALFGGDKSMSLEDAQQAKYNRILDKLNPTKGEHILEIGCGWGGFAEAAAKKGIKVTGITISDEQKKYADERIQRLGLDKLVKIEFKDYREIPGQFDYIVSIGMLEHVGERYWPNYFNVIKSRIKPGGSAMIQCITIDENVFEKTRHKHGFIDTYIFPGGRVPSKSRFLESVQNAGLDCSEIFTFGQDYALTLRQWLKRFERNRKKIKNLGYDESFIRMWRYYLASCIAAFTCNRTDVMQAEIRHIK
jgi:cyclopropane-fatty-acyl-phospholipid synthase